MAQHVQLRIDTGLENCFCDPQSSWQRGTNENTNGLLRQYFTKGTDLSFHGAEDLEAVAHALNTRPDLVGKLTLRPLASVLDHHCAVAVGGSFGTGGDGSISSPCPRCDSPGTGADGNRHGTLRRGVTLGKPRRRLG